ncbi:MAG: cytochrome c-type biogenesis protein CcmH [Acidobacteriota bacterium]
MKRNLWKRSFLFLVLVAAALAQTESEIESDSVKRVGTHIACQCGACSENVNCNMSSGQCHFCKPARTKIYKMQRAGMNDDQVIASFIREYGQAIFRADPNSFFWLVPYLSLAAGGGVLWLVLKRMRGHKPLTPATTGPALDDDPVLAKYRAAIEKDTDRLD